MGRAEKSKEINLYRNCNSRNRASDVRLFREFSLPVNQSKTSIYLQKTFLKML